MAKRANPGHRSSGDNALGEVRGKLFRFRFGDFGHRRIGFKRGNLIRDRRPLCNWFLGDRGNFGDRLRSNFRFDNDGLADGFE
jgi:hypothetical protein